MEPVVSQAFSHVATAAFNFSSWTASWSGHIVSEGGKAFAHVQRSVLYFFCGASRQNITPIAPLPSIVIASCIAKMVELRGSSGFFAYLSDEDRVNLLLAQPHLINKIVRFYQGDVEKIPAVWKRALYTAASAAQSLDLHDIPLRPIYIKRILQLFPDLKELNLTNCSLTDQCIYYLKNTRLETVKFDGNGEITEFGINWLSKLPAAKTIVMPAFTWSANLLDPFFKDALGRRVAWYPLPQTLEHLTVYSNKYPLCFSLPQFFSTLKKHCQNLKTIIIPEVGFRHQEVINGLKTLTTLEKLVLQDTDITDNQINELTSLVNLHTLEIADSYNNNFTNAIFGFLAKFKKLEQLIFAGATHVTAESIDLLSALPHFHSLSLRNLRLNNNGLIAVAKLTELQLLDLSGCSFTEGILPNTITALCGLSKLHTLGIPIGPRDPFLRHITALSMLQKLKLKVSLWIKNDDLALLPTLPELSELEITDYAYLTDQALDTLARCSKLKQIKLSDNTFTPEALNKFRLARPDIKILI